MARPKVLTAAEAARLIPDGAIVTVSSSSALGCPDAVLGAIGARFDAEGHPRNLTTLHPIAAGDMWGVKGIDHIAKPGCLAKILAGSYPSGPSSAEPPAIWKMVSGDAIPAYNVPSGIMFDMHREAAAKRPGVLTKVGMDTYVDSHREGCAMNAKAAAEPIVSRVNFAGEDWLFFPTIIPQVAIIRATTADERGNLSYEHEGGILGPLDQALSVRNNGGLVIAQVKRLAAATRDISQYVVDLSKTFGLAPGLKPIAGGVVVHHACHARAQNMGAKSLEMLRLIPDTQVDLVERCSGHGGTFGVMKETRPMAVKVGKPAARQVAQKKDETLCSDCPLACKHLGQLLIAELPAGAAQPLQAHPIEILARAYNAA